MGPSQGDVRLVALNATEYPTQPCDTVHLGAVEIFNNGEWGKICAPRPGGWTVDAIVICRQLGFPFGNVMDPNEARMSGFSDVFPSPPRPVTWASNVLCTGTEQRIADCSFPGSTGEFLEEYEGGCADVRTLAVICRRFEMDGMHGCCVYYVDMVCRYWHLHARNM